jgi:uncharacterized membrane protein
MNYKKYYTLTQIGYKIIEILYTKSLIKKIYNRNISDTYSDKIGSDTFA